MSGARRWHAAIAKRPGSTAARIMRARSAGGSSVEALEPLGLVVRAQRLDDLEEVAVHDRRQVVLGQADPVVGHAVLGEVVGPDLLGAVARADLGLAARSLAGELALALGLEDARAQDLHRLRAVLDLRALVLASDDDAGRQVGDA